MDPIEYAIITQYGIDETAKLGGGMEASVYALDEQTVLKVYGAATSGDQLRVLQDFYAGIDRADAPFALPRIRELNCREDRWVTIEDRLAGRLMTSLIADSVDLEQRMRTYLLALANLAQVRIAYPADRYRLYDAEGISRTGQGDWHQFLRRFVQHKVAEIKHFFLRDVRDLPGKLARLLAILARPYTGDYRLIHGDFFPGNLLCNAVGEICAVLDFGLFTMCGDWRYDLATACAFFDMYDELGCNARARLLQMADELFGADQRGVLYRYILIFSLIGANAYSPTCSDGHYEWCVQNLNNGDYWAGVE